MPRDGEKAFDTQFNLPLNSFGLDGLVVDLFAGGGGASTALERALGRPVDIAINHDARAVAMHEANHPHTRHYCENVFAIADPTTITDGRRIAVLWLSPDCTHHSKAKGGRPKKKHIRGLAWILFRWVRAGRPKVIFLENVEEWQDWGPLDEHGQPCKRRKGKTFNFWVARLRKEGYAVEWREMVAADYGAPTTRKRLFLVARCDGRPIVFPEPTHGDPKSEAVRKRARKPYRTAAEIIDWNEPCPSIFLRKDEAGAMGLRVQRPLADNTMTRIAKGLRRFVLEAKEPFIVTCNHSGPGFRGQDIRAPLKTVTASRDAHGVVLPSTVKATEETPVFECGGCGEIFTDPHASGIGGLAPAECPRCGEEGNIRLRRQEFASAPYVIKYHGSKSRAEARGARPDEPLRTLDTANRFSLATPFLTKFRKGSVGTSIVSPVPTVTANSFQKREGGAVPLGIVSPFLARICQTGGNGAYSNDVRSPVTTITTKAEHLLLTPYLVTMRDGSFGRSLAEPAPTGTGRRQLGLAAPYLVPRHGERAGQEPRCLSVEVPYPTVVPGGNGGQPVAVYLAQQNTGVIGHDARKPMSTIVGLGSTQTPVTAYLVREFGCGVGRPVGMPAPTVMGTGQGKTRLITGHLLKLKGGQVSQPSRCGSDARMPLPTITADGNHHGVVMADCAPFFTKFYGTGGQWARACWPLPTVTAKARFSLIGGFFTDPPITEEQRYTAWWTARLVEVYAPRKDDRPLGQVPEERPAYLTVKGHVIVDVGMRMLKPPELYRAQGFPNGYVIDRDAKGSPFTLAQQTRMCGNSVSPPPAEALIEANVGMTAFADGNVPMVAAE